LAANGFAVGMTNRITFKGLAAADVASSHKSINQAGKSDQVILSCPALLMMLLA